MAERCINLLIAEIQDKTQNTELFESDVANFLKATYTWNSLRSWQIQTSMGTNGRILKTMKTGHMPATILHASRATYEGPRHFKFCSKSRV